MVHGIPAVLPYFHIFKQPLNGMEEVNIEDLGIEIHCPNCSNEIANDPNSLTLAEAKCGAMLECGRCFEISSWRWTLNPFVLEQVENEFGGSIECDD